eukprot:103419-Amphidinium_carterae.1
MSLAPAPPIEYEKTCSRSSTDRDIMSLGELKLPVPVLGCALLLLSREFCPRTGCTRRRTSPMDPDLVRDRGHVPKARSRILRSGPSTGGLAPCLL